MSCGTYSNACSRVVERAVPARGLRLEQAHLALVVREILLHRQRRGSEYPRARAAADLLLENFRDGQRRGVELQRVVEYFQPAHDTIIPSPIPHP